MNKTSSESCELLESFELRDRELALVTGGSCAKAIAHFKEAQADFKAGNYLGGLIAMLKGDNELPDCSKQR